MDSYTPAESLRVALVSAIEAAGRPAFDRTYVDTQPPAVDCEELVVVAEGVRSGLPGVARTTPLDRATTWVGDFVIHAVRCVPSPRVVGDTVIPPKPDAVQHASEGLLADQAVILDAVLAWSSRCQSVVMAGSMFSQRQAGFAAGITRLQVQV